jgi:hypothetical protein
MGKKAQAERSVDEAWDVNETIGDETGPNGTVFVSLK